DRGEHPRRRRHDVHGRPPGIRRPSLHRIGNGGRPRRRARTRPPLLSRRVKPPRRQGFGLEEKQEIPWRFPWRLLASWRLISVIHNVARRESEGWGCGAPNRG